MSSLPGSLVVLTNYFETQRIHDESHKFVSESGFWYLCGIDAPGWRLIIDSQRRRSYAVYPVVDDIKQVFDGSLSPDQAQAVSGVDQVISSDEADSLIVELRKKHSVIYTAYELDYIKSQTGVTLNSAQKELTKYLQNRFEAVHDARDKIDSLRAIKQPVEIAAISKANQISAQAYLGLLDEISRFKYEYEVEAWLGYQFRALGGDGPAYSTIAASHKNACTLHYTANNQRLKRPSVLLIDAAASYQHYSADITRCLPIGKTTKRQQAVYEAVKLVFDQTVKLVKPGTSLQSLQETANDLIKEALRSLGLDNDDQALRRYFPHAIGHSLGLDTHDTFGGRQFLEAGMALTIEPGIYIPEESIGVRYEDNFVVTDKGHDNLTDAHLGDIWYTNS